MDLIKAYYDHILDIFIDVYGDTIKFASPGHCMKVTSLSLDVLRDLYTRLSKIETKTQIYILTEDEELTGKEYITPTKLIELRNDLTFPILVLIPVNSFTSAEDSYGNATFRELSINDFDARLSYVLETQLNGVKGIKQILVFAEKALNVPIQDKVRYLLYVSLNGGSEEAVGNGLYLLGLIPDSNIVSKNDYIPQFLSKNDECQAILSDYSISIADKIGNLPIKAGTLQDDVAKLLREQDNVDNRKSIGEKILDDYPQLNFSKWYGHLKNIVALGELHITKVDIVRKGTDRLVLKIDPKKGAKVKLRIWFSPKPSAYEQLKKVKVLMMNGDGYYEETELCTKKVSENAKEYRDISFTVTDQFVAGTYFFQYFVCGCDDFRHDITPVLPSHKPVGRH